MNWTTTDTTSTNFWSALEFRVHVVPPNPPLPQKFIEAVFQACAWLELEPPLHSHEQVKQARKKMAKQHHPDVGGDADAMKQMNAAADFLLEMR